MSTINGIRNKGFTLIELIVVVGILSVIVTVAMIVLDPVSQVQKASDSRRKADLAQIQKALESYYQDNGNYPDTKNYLIVDLTNGPISWGKPWVPYMNIMPKDPNPEYKYAYFTPKDRQSYYLYATLERGDKDPQACKGGLICDSISTNGVSTTACTNKTVTKYSGFKVCNYAVTSPDVSP